MVKQMVAWLFVGASGAMAQSAMLNLPRLSQHARITQRIGITYLLDNKLSAEEAAKYADDAIANEDRFEDGITKA
jgi:hypothetical protein